jgi:hypothetical protein
MRIVTDIYVKIDVPSTKATATVATMPEPERLLERPCVLDGGRDLR